MIYNSRFKTCIQDKTQRFLLKSEPQITNYYRFRLEKDKRCQNTVTSLRHVRLGRKNIRRFKTGFTLFRSDFVTMFIFLAFSENFFLSSDNDLFIEIIPNKDDFEQISLRDSFSSISHITNFLQENWRLAILTFEYTSKSFR